MDYHIDIDRLKVVSPCATDWQARAGDDRVRFCGKCNKNVYYVAEMTRTQVEGLIAATGGQFCATLYRQADGNLLTRAEPARAQRWRAPRFASALITAALSLTASISAPAASLPQAVTANVLQAQS